MEERLQAGQGHKVSLNNRKNILLTGIQDVLSFDDREVLLETLEGMLMIRGIELHVNRLTLDKGEVDIEGRIDSLTYSEHGGGKNSESFLGRLFK